MGDGVLLMHEPMIAGVPGQKTRPRPEEEGLSKRFFVGYGHSSCDDRLNKKRAHISFHDDPCLHFKRAAIDVLRRNHGQLDSPTSNDSSDKKVRIEYLWKEFFSSPSQWWDNRLTKRSRRQPDFKHKITFEVLWIEHWLNPPWVRQKFANVAFDLIQVSGGLPSRPPPSFGIYDEAHKLTTEGRLKEALDLLELTVQQTFEAPQSTFVGLLRGCTRMEALAEGKRLHALIVKTKCNTNIFLSNLLIGMYSACGAASEALKVFTAMPRRNVFSWTAMISAYVQSREYKEAVTLVQQMHEEGIEPDEVACVVALKACTNYTALEQGRHLHSLVLRKGYDSNAIIQTTLLDMYAKCGCLKDAQEVFDNMTIRDVVSWNAMIAGYAQDGFGNEALHLYKQMKEENMEPNDVTLVLLLKACASISALEQGKQLHTIILEKGLESELIVQTTLVGMYAKCGRVNDAREMFDNMTVRDVVSWNAIIAGYAEEGLKAEALDLYRQMKREGMEPNYVTFVLLLNGCASISALQQGKQLHSLILKKGFESELIVQNTLVDMYSKCGCLKDARELFDNMTIRDVVSWNAMIAGYAQEGLGKEALELYEQMKSEGLQANDTTYSCVLSACSHSGLVDEGSDVFESIPKGHGVTPTPQHYACMVDLLSRAGRLSDAEDLILKLPLLPSKIV